MCKAFGARISRSSAGDGHTATTAAIDPAASARTARHPRPRSKCPPGRSGLRQLETYASHPQLPHRPLARRFRGSRASLAQTATPPRSRYRASAGKKRDACRSDSPARLPLPNTRRRSRRWFDHSPCRLTTSTNLSPAPSAEANRGRTAGRCHRHPTETSAPAGPRHVQLRDEIGRDANRCYRRADTLACRFETPSKIVGQVHGPVRWSRRFRLLGGQVGYLLHDLSCSVARRRRIPTRLDAWRVSSESSVRWPDT